MPLKVTEILLFEEQSKIELPIFTTRISAGFPSPADGDIEAKQDLNQLLIRNPLATYFVRVSGDSMIDAGIHSGDILIIDKSLEPTEGKIVIAAIDGDLTVKRLKRIKGKLYLIAENANYAPIPIEPESDFQIWGTVTYVVHNPN